MEVCRILRSLAISVASSSFVIDVMCLWQFPQLEAQINCQLLYGCFTYLLVFIRKL